MDAIRKRKAFIVPETALGLCLWEMEDGSKHGGGFISDEKNSYLSMEGIVGDKKVEQMMREAARYWTGEDGGKPHWINGARQVTDSERDDQSERLADGLIPDWEEAQMFRHLDGASE